MKYIEMYIITQLVDYEKGNHVLLSVILLLRLLFCFYFTHSTHFIDFVWQQHRQSGKYTPSQGLQKMSLATLCMQRLSRMCYRQSLTQHCGHGFMLTSSRCHVYCEMHHRIQSIPEYRIVLFRNTSIVCHLFYVKKAVRRQDNWALHTYTLKTHAKTEIQVEAIHETPRCYPYSEPVYTGWSSVHWNATGMPLVDPVYTGIPLGDPANTCRVHWNTTGKNLVETAPHWNAIGEI